VPFQLDPRRTGFDLSNDRWRVAAQISPRPSRASEITPVALAAVLYTPPQVHVHSAWTVWSPMESALVRTDYVESMCTPHGLYGVLANPYGLHTKTAWSED
jgi:hypothetical protein